ncbi:hypothetical protein FQA39_LY06640 [Lamprigera yunnana]|nr:hypothetical protein FQA39_LY06640 [Lamprigera yunnana]
MAEYTSNLESDDEVKSEWKRKKRDLTLPGETNYKVMKKKAILQCSSLKAFSTTLSCFVEEEQTLTEVNDERNYSIALTENNELPCTITNSSLSSRESDVSLGETYKYCLAFLSRIQSNFHE